MTKFCTNCGAQLNQDSKFCQSCGSAATGSTPVEALNQNPSVTPSPTPAAVDAKAVEPVIKPEASDYSLLAILVRTACGVGLLFLVAFIRGTSIDASFAIFALMFGAAIGIFYKHQWLVVLILFLGAVIWSFAR